MQEMNCCVHSRSFVADQTREAKRDDPIIYSEFSICTGEATHEVMEDGWKPLCSIHAKVYQDYQSDREFRILQFIIDEEPELV